jgi:DNA-binding CsgD family transcriptional regulator
VVVGRPRELEQIEAFVRGGREGFAALVLEGEAGAGKTTLWRAGVAAARESGVEVLVARPAREEQRLGLTGLADLLADVVPGADGELPEPQRHALRGALALEEPAGMEPRVLGMAVRGVLETLAARAPVVVAIDDLQWIDAASAAALAFALRRLERSSLRLFAARRVEETSVLRLEHETVLALPPLSIGAVQRLLASELDLTLPRRTLRRLYEASGGNPLFALELARALIRRGRRFAPLEHVPVPASLGGLLRERLAALPEETREVLAPAALLVLPTVELLAAVVPAEVWPALRPALAAGIVELEGDRLSFTHPLLAATVAESIDPQRRKMLHGRLAPLLPEGEERARHLADAARGPDADAAAALERAAAVARGRGAVDVASELLERAARLAADADEHARLMIAAARAYTAAEDAAHADALLLELLPTLGRGVRRAEALLERIHADVDRSAVPSLAEQALAEAGEDDRLRTQILLALADWEEVTLGLCAAEARAREALDAAEGTHDDALLLPALAYLGHLKTLGVGDEWRSLLERSRVLETTVRGSVRPWLAPAHWLGVRLMWEDRLEEARALLKAEYARAEAEGDLPSHASLAFHLTQLETRAGSPARARAYAEQALALSAPGGGEQGPAINLYALALVEAVFGEAERARALADEALGVFERLGDRFFTIHTRSALGLLELSLGDHAAAAAALTPLRHFRAETGVQEPGIFPFDADEIEALLGSGRIDEAGALVEELLARGREFDRPRLLATGFRCQGLVLAARGDLARAIAAMDQALLAHQRLPVPLERGRTLLVLGAVQRRARRKRDARASLERAVEVFARAGANRWGALARAELARIGGRRSSGLELTEAERRVAALAVEGMTNKEVAAALFLSVNTVETTLRRVYRKLGVRSRVELARRATQHR